MIPPKKNYICPICNTILKRMDSCIQWDSCDGWVYLSKCSLLLTAGFELLAHTDYKWHCSKCVVVSMHFHDVEDGDLFLVNLGIDCNILIYHLFLGLPMTLSLIVII